MDLIGGGGVFFFLPFFLFLSNSCYSDYVEVDAFGLGEELLSLFFCTCAGDVILFHALRPQTHTGDYCCFFHILFLICIVLYSVTCTCTCTSTSTYI